MSSALDAPDRPAVPETFRSVSTSRRIKNQAATVLVTLAFLIAVIPLVWLLVSVIVKGLPAIV
jgi:phosphate transport system permease protein